MLNEPKQPIYDPLSSITDITSDAKPPATESSLESDDGSIGPARKRKSTRNANNNDKEQSTRDESPDTKERNELAKILFNSTEKKFKRNLDEPPYDSNECKLICWFSFILVFVFNRIC